MAEPSSVGATHRSTIAVLVGTAVKLVGAAGAVGEGTTTPEGPEATLVPTELVAVTVKVYESPFVSPLTKHVSGPVVQVQVCPPRVDKVESVARTL